MIFQGDIFSNGKKTQLLGDETHPAWRYRESSPDSSEMHEFVALTEDALKSIVISIEMVELVKCLLPPVQNEHIS